MKPVNLLPEGQRPRGSGNATGAAPKVVIGVLAALLAMVAGYVFSANQVSSRQAEIATVRAEAEQARARAAALAPYAQLATIKQTRVAAVRELAGGRFDWERLIREIAMVLPAETWLLGVTASTTGEGLDGAAPAEPGAAAAAAIAPTVKLDGCAPSQPSVATLLVRLRKLHRVTDVELGESRRESSDGGATDSAGPSADGCGAKGFHFDVTATFEAGTAVVSERPERVPAALGGGQ